MASNKRTIYLGLDYSQFTGGVTEVNRKMGLLDAEFKLAQQQAKNYGTATDELGLKQEYLTQKIALQAQKVEEAKRAYDAAMSSQNASQKEIDALDKKLLQERTTLEKLNGQLKEADENIQAADKDTKSFGDEIRGLASAMGIEVSPAVERLAKKFDGMDASVGNAILVVGALVGTFAKLAVSNAETADSLNTLASQTGLTTQELQKLQYASQFVDVSVETMTGSITKLTQSMSKARDGSKESEEAFKKLHIRITDGSGALRDANDVFYETIDKLGKVKNETERDALAMKLFGKSAKELNPLIEAGSKRLKELGIEAENLNLVWSDEQMGKAQRLQDALDKFQSAIQGFKEGLGMVLLPMLTSLLEALSKIDPKILATIAVIAGVVVVIVNVVKAIKSLTGTASAISSFFKTFDFAANKTKLIIIGIVAAVITLIALLNVLFGKSKETETAMENVKNGISGVTGAITGAQQNAANNYGRTATNATGVAEFAGGKTWVGEAGPELVTLPQGSSITPADQAGSRIENNYYNITIDAKNVDDFNKVVQLAQQQRMAERRLAY